MSSVKRGWSMVLPWLVRFSTILSVLCQVCDPLWGGSMFLKVISKGCTLLTLVRQKKTLPSDFVSILLSPCGQRRCHWLENRTFKNVDVYEQLFWKKPVDFLKQQEHLDMTFWGPITLTYKGQQTTLRPWDPSRCLDAQPISCRFRAIKNLSWKNVRNFPLDGKVWEDCHFKFD